MPRIGTTNDPPRSTTQSGLSGLGASAETSTRMAVPDVSNYVYKGSLGCAGRTAIPVGPAER